MLRAMSRCWLLVALFACSSPTTRTVSSDGAAPAFEDVVARVTQHLHQFEPAEAVSLGHHELDGKLPDRSRAGLANMTAQLAQDRAALVALTPSTPRARMERDVLLFEVRSLLFSLTQWRRWHTNPMAYSGAINLDAYIIRDYAPPRQRARAVVDLCTGLPRYLADARANLERPIPRTWIDTALLQTKGYAQFADEDVRQVLAPVDPSVGPALDTCKAALLEHAAWLEAQQPQGTTAFALGEARFLEMLAETQGVTIDLDRLAQIAEADLARNLAAVEDAARAIDPKRPVTDVVATVDDDKPAPQDVLALATDQATAMRQFLVDRDIVGIPSKRGAVVRESPPFQRWNSAFLDAPGPFETADLPSYYYISPPDPKWPAAEQRAYIPSKPTSLYTTIHEVWPGHFLQHLHRDQQPSPVLRSYCAYSFSEGWAHYTEEMMFDAGAGDRTPQNRIGMLKEALLRNVRFVVTIGEHARGMTVDEATTLFAAKAYLDPQNARQQAVRGTFDPMYLAYTLGKLMIVKLREDWMKQHPGATLRQFHDELLSHGCPPVPLVRAAMLGPSAGPAL